MEVIFMNMEIVQICDITLATKFTLKTKTNIEYFPFEYEKNIEFLFSKNKIDFLEKNYKARNIEEWFDYCLNLGLEDIKILLPVSSKNLNIPNDLNTNKIKLICYFKNNLILYFTPKWKKKVVDGMLFILLTNTRILAMNNLNFMIIRKILKMY